MSAETRLSPNDRSYGEWASEVLDALELDQTRMIGLSYGGGILLRLASLAPERIARSAFVVPAALAPLRPRWSLLRLVTGMLAYRIFPHRGRLNRAARPLFTDQSPEDWVEALDAVLRHVRLEKRMPRVVTREEVSGFRAPTLVVAAEHDPLFPASAVRSHALRALPHAKVLELEGESHILSSRGLRRMNGKLEEHFLADNASDTPFS